MHQPNAAHPTHDLTLVAAHAAGDLPEADRSRAEALLASCSQCADLRRDLIAIAEATHSLPAPFARGRDFQLEPAQADRLRRGSWLRRALRPFGTVGSPARPLAAALTTLGVAGLLVATALPGLAGGAATRAPQRDTVAGAAAASAAPAQAPAASTGSVPAPEAGGSTSNPADFNANQHASGAPAASAIAGKAGSSQSAIGGPVAIGTLAGRGTFVGDASEPGQPSVVATSGSPNLLLVGSLALLVIGLLLFGLRFAGRRVR
ncbi:MAG TPA: hypothetical protein VE011_04920 [Candidatus Dormibacteraeota bacterium]|nr:hypothetical protein [Candidatus Dormibacteraeota bacterium]